MKHKLVSQAKHVSNVEKIYTNDCRFFFLPFFATGY